MPYERTMIYTHSGRAHTETERCQEHGCTPAVQEPKEGGHLEGLTTGEVLKAIDDWARTAPSNAMRNLWDVLTALRGPDDDDYELKGETTGVIRHHALPYMSSVVGVVSSTGPLPSVDKYMGPSTTARGGGHFRSHVIQAIRALQQIEKERN